MKVVQQGFIHHTIKIAHEGFPWREVLAILDSFFKTDQITGDTAQKSLSLANQEEWETGHSCLRVQSKLSESCRKGRVSV